jgi:uncharacterized Zn-finger protein
VSGRLHAPATLPPEKEPLEPIGWATEPVWSSWRENSWPYRHSSSDPSVVQPVASRRTDCGAEQYPSNRSVCNVNNRNFCCAGEKPHICEVCNKGFSTSSSLNTHRRIHSGDKPHQCLVCGKRFTASSNLYYHRMTHTKVTHRHAIYAGKSLLNFYHARWYRSLKPEIQLNNTSKFSSCLT